MTTETPALDQIHDLATNYADRQGLRIVPIALMIMIQSARPVAPTILGFDAVLMTIVVGLAGYFLVGRYYAKRFGTVEAMPQEGLPVVGQILLLVVCFIIAVITDIVAQPPVFLSGLLIAIWLIATAWPSRYIRRQYLVIGIILGLLSVIEPLVGKEQAVVAADYGTIFGVLLLYAGISDHARFTRIFPAVERTA